MVQPKVMGSGSPPSTAFNYFSWYFENWYLSYFDMFKCPYSLKAKAVQAPFGPGIWKPSTRRGSITWFY